MANFFRKAWPHILILGLLVIFVFVAPRIYTLYFVQEGKPVPVLLPPETSQVKFNVEVLKPYDEKGTYALEGWSFLTANPEIPTGDYERQVVLVSDTERFAFPVDSSLRTDIQVFFESLGLDVSQSGFSALISRNSLAKGVYSIGLVFKHEASHQAYYVNTGRCITRTPNQLILEALDSPICGSLPAPVGGAPIQQDAALPAETSAAQYWVDGMEQLDDQGTYSLWGWAFLTSDVNLPAGGYSWQVALISGMKNYVFLADLIERADIQTQFSDLGMDLTQSGFYTLIASGSLEPGSYSVGLVLQDNTTRAAYLIDTKRCLTRTAEGLVLEEPGSTACGALPAARSGHPVNVNAALPAETTEAKFYVEGLESQAEQGVYRLYGWAFLTADTTIPAGDYVRQMILNSGTRNYVFSAEPSLRTDVQAYFSDLGMALEMSGFSALMDGNALEPGMYNLGLLFKLSSTGEAWVLDARRCLTRTADSLVLETAGALACTIP